MIDPPFALTDEEKTRLAKFEVPIANLSARIQWHLARRLRYLRQIAREKGIIAKKLKDLKTEDGYSFEESSPRKLDYRRIRQARAVGLPERLQRYPFLYPRYKAYFCDQGCSWVRGVPGEKKYDDIGPLCGSAGIEYHCVICEGYLGQAALICS